MQDKSKVLLELYEESIKTDNLLKASEYLASRGILNQPEIPIGYIPFHHSKYLTIADSIVMPVCNVQSDEIVLLDFRGVSENKKAKVKVREHHYYIYNLKHALNQFKKQGNDSFVIITESVIDALSLLRISPSLPVISALSASMSKISLHLLSIFNNIIFAFDNDSVGISKTKEYIEFFESNYPDINVTTISDELIGKDLNEELLLYNKSLEAIALELALSYT